MLKNDCLSVKCVLLTDKSAKNGALSVNSSEILVRCPEQEKIRTITGTDFHHYSVVAFGSTPCLIRFQLAFPLSQARTPWTRRARLRSPKACVRAHDKFVPRRDCAFADRSRPSLSTALLSGWSSHLVLKCHILEMQFALQISSYKVACHAQNSVNDRTHRTIDACRNEINDSKGDRPHCNQFQC